MSERIEVLKVLAAAAARVELSGAPRYAVRIRAASEAISEVISAQRAVQEMEANETRPPIDVEREVYARRDAAIANLGGCDVTEEAAA